MNSEKVLDISKFCVIIKDIAAEYTVASDEGRGFYGKISVCFQNGKFTLLERHESVK